MVKINKSDSKQPLKQLNKPPRPTTVPAQSLEWIFLGPYATLESVVVQIGPSREPDTADGVQLGRRIGKWGLRFFFYCQRCAALQWDDGTQRAEALITLQYTNPFCLFACNSFTTDTFTVSVVAAVTQIYFFFLLPCRLCHCCQGNGSDVAPLPVCANA